MYRSLVFFLFVALARSQSDDAALLDEIFGDNSKDTTTVKEVFEDGVRKNVTDTTKEGLEDKKQTEVDRSNESALNVSRSTDANGNASCSTATGEAGRCVASHLCEDRGDSDSVIDPHYDPCEPQLETCCPVASIRVAEDNQQQPERAGCGWRNPDGVGRRVVGLTDEDTKFAEFPWMVAILRAESQDKMQPGNGPREVYVGGGSLIHPSVVLTTAHNVADKKGLRVRAGEWDTRTNSEPHPTQDRDVVEVRVHEDYISGTLYYDVAVLFLASPMQLAPNVGVVCLPPQNDRPRANTRCLVSGWGKEQFGKEGSLHVILRKTELPVVDRNTCLRKLRSTRLGNLFELHTSFMCAGGEPNNNICRGDSGAPLVCPIEFEPERYQQTGMVAWGVGCGEDGTPGVYVDVAKVRTWIDNMVAGKIYDPKVYTV